jgi:hypothetical protein
MVFARCGRTVHQQPAEEPQLLQVVHRVEAEEQSPLPLALLQDQVG